MTTDLAEAVALLMEARDFGQFSDDMLDHPSPDVRSPVKSVREALRLVIDSPEFQALAQRQQVPEHCPACGYELTAAPSAQAQPQGELCIVKNDAGQIVAVTRCDADGRILETIAESAQPQEPPRSAPLTEERDIQGGSDGTTH